MLASRYRIRLDADFRRARQTGKSWAHQLVIMCAVRNHLDCSRYGFAASRRVGKAVVRNRARRRMREVIRLKRPLIDEGWDIVFVARACMAQASYAEIARAMEDLLRRAGLSECKQTPDQPNGVPGQ
jgi:ribonuclease P protein component